MSDVCQYHRRGINVYFASTAAANVLSLVFPTQSHVEYPLPPSGISEEEAAEQPQG